MLKKIFKKIKERKRKEKALNSFGGNIKISGELSARLIKKDGTIIDLGVLSKRVVTTAWCEYGVDNMIAETSGWGDFKYHATGTGSTGALVGDTALEFEVGTRGTGTQVEDTSLIYKTIATVSYTATYVITELGIFNQLALGGILMDRHTFTGIPVDNGDSIEFTHKHTWTAGG